MDLITELEELALASRLRRLSDRLMRDVSGIYDDLDVVFKARWFPVVQALGRRSPMSVTETAHALGLTHPAVNQVVADLVRSGLVSRRRDTSDERRILLALTAAGRRTIKRLSPVWDEVRLSNADLLAETKVDLLGDVRRIERALDERTMADRVRDRLGLPPVDAVEIVDYRPAYKKHFAALNLAWLEEHFGVEDHDRRLLEDPNRRILKKGGAMLFALLRGEVAGTCALLRIDDETLELTKMAVAVEHRGRGLGRALGEAAIARAREMGAARIDLATSPELEAACGLYESLGFVRVDDGPAEAGCYERCSISMRLELGR